MLFTLLPALAIAAIGIAIGEAVVVGVCIAIAVVLFIIGAVISTALSQIFAVALYRFAIGQGATGEFSEEELAGAVRPRRLGRAGI
jgi:hypothetical protein